MATRVSAAGVHDARARVPALTPKAVVEANAETAELGDPRRSLLRQQPHRARPAQAPSGGERVRRVKRRVVVGAYGSGHSSLSRVAVRAAV